MIRPFEFFIAARYMRSRRQEKMVSIIATLSFIGIMLGVATLIIVTAVMNGFHKELLGQILGLNGHLRLYETNNAPLMAYEKLVEDVKKMEGISIAHPLIERQALASAHQGATAAIVHGLKISDLQARPLLREHLKWGSLELGPDDILIGIHMANKLGVHLGDPVSLILPQGSTSPFGNVPRKKTFRVKGIFEVGMVNYDTGYLFMPLESAQIFFRLPEACTNIELFIEDLHKADQRVLQLLKALPPHVGVLDWQKANTGYFEAIKVERNVMFIILTLIILVAVFNVISSLIMLVKDKTGDIAILRTIGTGRSSILRIFMLIGMSIGLTGTLLGGALGILIATNIEHIRKGLESLTHSNLFQAEIYFLSKVPAQLEVSEVVGIMAMALVLTLLAALYPAWRASRLDPIESLRQI